MKKSFTLLVSSLFSLSLLAFDGSGLKISAMNTRTNIKVELDGRKVFMKDNIVFLGNLPEGYHNVRIYREVNFNEAGNSFGTRDQIIYSTSILLSKTYHTDMVISEAGKVFVQSYRIGPETIWYYGDDDISCGENEKEMVNEPRTMYGKGMGAREFHSLKESIGKARVENARMTAAKAIIDKNHLTTQQVKELMLLFKSENNRLSLAKYAFRKTADKENYSQLNEALKFNSSKEALARFMRESR